MKIGLLSVPVKGGASCTGCEHGPQAIHNAGVMPVLQKLGYTVIDYGEATLPHQVLIYDHISAESYFMMQDGIFPIFLGGDHSISIGTINGVADYWEQEDRPLFVLWVDAHADYNTPMISPTGNMHGMAAAFLCGEPGFEGLLKVNQRYSIAPSQLHLYGTRSIDHDERGLLQERNIRINEPIDQWLEGIKRCNGVLHLSFDVDVLDPEIAPGTGTPVQNGNTLAEIENLFKKVRESGLLCSLDIVELNPTLDDGRTTKVILQLVKTLFGD